MRKAKATLGFAIAFLAASMLILAAAFVMQTHERAANLLPSPNGTEQILSEDGSP